MSISAQNAAYAKQLGSKMMELPPIGLKAAANVALLQATLRTVQDSGAAAYNWSLAWDGEPMQPFLGMRGVSPVGVSGEHRGEGHRAVIGPVIQEAKASAPEGAMSVKLYNPIRDPEHEWHARVVTAGTHAMDPAPMNARAGRAMNAHLR